MSCTSFELDAIPRLIEISNSSTQPWALSFLEIPLTSFGDCVYSSAAAYTVSHVHQWSNIHLATLASGI